MRITIGTVEPEHNPYKQKEAVNTTIDIKFEKSEARRYTLYYIEALLSSNCLQDIANELKTQVQGHVDIYLSCGGV